MRTLLVLALPAGLLLTIACSGKVTSTSNDGSGASSATGGTGGAYGMGGTPTTGGLTGTGGADCHDADGDTLSDEIEGYSTEFPQDWDGDSTPDYLDSDSDDDGILDVDEAGKHPPCEWGRNTDGKDVDDFRDEDSDDDGLLDKDEITHGYDPVRADSDDNGCSDLEEYSFDECDPSNVLMRTDYCYGSPGSTLESMKVSSTIPADLSDLSITVTPGDATQGGYFDADPQYVAPASAGKVEDDMLLSVGPGAEVGLLLELDSAEPSNRYTVRIESVSQGVIGEMQVLWLLDVCPVLK